MRDPTDSLPFHRGQWAAQFAGGAFVSVGFLKFRSQTKALVFDIRVTGGHGETLTTDSTGTHFSSLGSSADITARFGWRRYHANGPKVAGHYSFGLLGGFKHSVGVAPGFRDVSNGFDAGLFGDVGGSYFLTPKFSIGATIGAAISYSEVYSRDTRGVKQRSWDLGGSAPCTSRPWRLDFWCTAHELGCERYSQ